jgi:hypothetical protein
LPWLKRTLARRGAGRAWSNSRETENGLRQIRRNPGFSGLAIATLALGIDGITAMFSAFDAILVRPLSYANAAD